MNSSPVLESSIEPVAIAEHRPIQERERIAALDVLRGVALLGILAMNIRSFAGPFATYTTPTLVYEYSGASRVAFWATTLVFDTKMMSIFSMLFGAGALVYGAKELGGKTSPTRLWYRRNFWLLVIGLIHGYLIWEGDILVIYSLCASSSCGGRESCLPGLWCCCRLSCLPLADFSQSLMRYISMILPPKSRPKN